jgi:hypothetical protein
MNHYSQCINNIEYVIYENINILDNNILSIDIDKLDNCIDYLNNSYYSTCVYNKIKQRCYFSISYQL